MTVIKGKRLADRGLVSGQMHGLSVKISTGALRKLHLLSLVYYLHLLLLFIIKLHLCGTTVRIAIHDKERLHTSIYN